MAISVVDPINSAINRTGRTLFKPFDIGKWLVLGFCAFLAYLGEGGGGGGNFFNFPGGQGGGGSKTQQTVDWIMANLLLVVTVVIIGLLIIMAMVAVVSWLRSRGKFMFLDGVVHNRGAVVEPWKAFRRLANSLSIFTFVLWIISTVTMLLILAMSLLIAWPDIQAGRFGGSAITAVAVGGILLVVTVVALVIISVLLDGFVVPTMYLRNQPVMTAWSTVRRELVAGPVGTIALFFLMKLVLGVLIGFIAIVATCATCCLAALPYIGSVILLPLIVFNRCYSLYFMEQFGPDWKFFPPES